jgi:protein-S-isoprenylcysteine O-methyltransferase Ste14
MHPPNILPPHYFVAALAVIALLGATTERTLLPFWAMIAGAIVMAIGLAIALTASRQFSAAGTNILPFTPSTALVTNGMFAFTRNPMYLAAISHRLSSRGR